MKFKNLLRLHEYEELCRQKALNLITGDTELVSHMSIIQQTMDMADMLRQFKTEDEDLKVIQIFGMRIFNAFAASIKLVMAGYSQNSALIMRDILETVFLLDMFSTDKSSISTWRLTEDSNRHKKFSPPGVRKILDARDGFTQKRRAERYKTFSELAGHPTMKSDYLLRHEPDGDAFIGPFVEHKMLKIMLTEMGSLACEASTNLDIFFPDTWNEVKSARENYSQSRNDWLQNFLH
jgi:hypothetical protein